MPPWSRAQTISGEDAVRATGCWRPSATGPSGWPRRLAGRRRAAPPGPLPGVRPHHRAQAARGGPAAGHRAVPARVREPAHRAPPRRRRRGGAGGALPGASLAVPYWMMRDLNADARQWAEAVAALGPDPFAPPGVRPLPAGADHRPAAAVGAGAGGGGAARGGTDPAGQHGPRDGRVAGPRGAGAAPGHQPHLPGRAAADLPYARFALDVLHPAHRRGRRTPGADGRDGPGLPGVRLPVGARRRAGDAGQDPRQPARLGRRGAGRRRREPGTFPARRRLGSRRSLSSRGEANERAGRLTAATEDYLAAIEYARALGARAQVAVLRARYAGVLSELDRFEEAEAILREIVDGGRSAGHEAVPTARPPGLPAGTPGPPGRGARATGARPAQGVQLPVRSASSTDSCSGCWPGWTTSTGCTARLRAATPPDALGRSQDRLSR
ncbi:hypothetical protein SMICM17S_02638 [Streptomyces microflavus]